MLSKHFFKLFLELVLNFSDQLSIYISTFLHYIRGFQSRTGSEHSLPGSTEEIVFQVPLLCMFVIRKSFEKCPKVS